MRAVSGSETSQAVNCRYCGFSNPDDEHRCQHCGRRLHVEVPLAGSAIPLPRPEPERVERRAASAGPPRQGALFAGPKVVPFESLAPARNAERRRSAAVRKNSPPAAAPANQQHLNFHPRSPRRQAAAYEDAPVAPAALRLKAAAVDGAVFAAGLGVAAAAFHYMGGQFALSMKTAYYYGGALASMLLAYRLFWCVLGRDSAGMQWFGMRVITFDGYPPGTRRRMVRLLATLLSVGGGGWGVLWALLDEEHLALHDHISQTFPTVKK
jgi:uncharacterized RDD family membrane protein YckC